MKYLSIDLYLVLRKDVHYFSGKLVTYNGILLYISYVYENTSIGYYSLNSSLNPYITFNPIQIRNDLDLNKTNPNNCIFPESCKYVFNNDFDIRMHAFSNYEK